MKMMWYTYDINGNKIAVVREEIKRKDGDMYYIYRTYINDKRTPEYYLGKRNAIDECKRWIAL